MNCHPNGIVIILSNRYIFNHSQSWKQLWLPTIIKLKKNLSETLNFLRYTVEVYQDCEAQTMVEIFNSIKYSVLQIHGSFACCSLSEEMRVKIIFVSDGGLVNLDHFTSDLIYCENFHGKPCLNCLYSGLSSEGSWWGCNGHNYIEDERKVKIPLRVDIFLSFSIYCTWPLIKEF